MLFTIKSKFDLLDTIRILSRRHWDVYEDENIVGGNAVAANTARQALDAYAFALQTVKGRVH